MNGLARAIRSGALTLAFLCVALLLSSCTRTKPNAEECRAGLRNFLRLQTGGALSDEDLDRLVTEGQAGAMAADVCLRKKTLLQVQCEIDAQSIRDLDRCRRMIAPD